MSEILSVTGRDVPAMPDDRAHAAHAWEWLHWVCPVFGLLRAVPRHDWPAITVWVVLLAIHVVGLLLRSKRAITNRLAVYSLTALLGASGLAVFIAHDPVVRWAGVWTAITIAAVVMAWRSLPSPEQR